MNKEKLKSKLLEGWECRQLRNGDYGLFPDVISSNSGRLPVALISQEMIHEMEDEGTIKVDVNSFYHSVILL